MLYTRKKNHPQQGCHPIVVAAIILMATTSAFGFTSLSPQTTKLTTINSKRKMTNTRQSSPNNISSSSSSLFMSSSNNNDDNNAMMKQLQEKARVARLEAEQLEASYVLDKIDALLKRLEKEKDTVIFSSSSAKSVLEERIKLQNQVLDLAKRIDPEMASSLQTKFNIGSSTAMSSVSNNNSDGKTLQISNNQKDERTKPLPAGLSLEDVEAAKLYLETLPVPLQDTFAKAATYYEKDDANKYKTYQEVIFKTDLIITMYENRYSLTPSLMQILYKESLTSNMKTGEEKDDIYDLLAKKGFKVETLELDEEQMKRDSLVEGLFPRVLRKQDEDGVIIGPSEADLITFLNAIKETNSFSLDNAAAPGGTDKITGGYILR
eukprot:6318499-Ditylum_brightwellii.AAC.1